MILEHMFSLGCLNKYSGALPAHAVSGRYHALSKKANGRDDGAVIVMENAA